ncbi:hypothetical protein NA57DRAFT_51754 [Rhizodiscina lignyota]|uniref:Uncharacterized protein n=1 Tax=Rhizodiscina lignyota TaxID=1504668 RepID=A0A9P4MH07_9PEZI|nr:hypothetical protein NA57DRAFT_51754 [Rhizodiscina lignyota]
MCTNNISLRSSEHFLANLSQFLKMTTITISPLVTGTTHLPLSPISQSPISMAIAEVESTAPPVSSSPIPTTSTGWTSTESEPETIPLIGPGASFPFELFVQRAPTPPRAHLITVPDVPSDALEIEALGQGYSPTSSLSFKGPTYRSSSISPIAEEQESFSDNTESCVDNEPDSHLAMAGGPAKDGWGRPRSTRLSLAQAIRLGVYGRTIHIDRKEKRRGRMWPNGFSAAPVPPFEKMETVAEEEGEGVGDKVRRIEERVMGDELERARKDSIRTEEEEEKL